MKREDFRGIGRDAQEALRARAVYLVVEQGETQGMAADVVGTSRQVVNGWVKRYQQSGTPVCGTDGGYRPVKVAGL